MVNKMTIVINKETLNNSLINVSGQDLTLKNSLEVFNEEYLHDITKELEYLVIESFKTSSKSPDDIYNIYIDDSELEVSEHEFNSKRYFIVLSINDCPVNSAFELKSI